MKGSRMNLSFGPEIIFDDAEFQLGDRDKAGIVGVNGAGKTTLFRLLRGEIALDGGTLSVGRARVGYLPQEIVFDRENETVWEYLSAGRPLQKIKTELEEIYRRLETAPEAEHERLLERMAYLQEQLDYFDQYEADDILLSLMEEMKIDADLLDRRLAELSGGQKSKLAFARVLYSKPEVLCLDEPTNHLEAATLDYVTDYLKNYKGSVLIISHDVDFLNRIVRKIVFINKVTHKISVYDGNYDVFKKQRAEEQRARERQISLQEREIKKLEDFVQRAREASQTNHKLKRKGQERALRLEKMRDRLPVRERPYRRVKMDIRPKREGATVPLSVEELSFRYPGQRFLYRKLSFKLSGGERFLVVGENGVGKSTLLKLIMGFLPPVDGQIRFNPKTDAAYYAQELEQLDADKTVFENVETDGYNEWQLRGILSNFLFYEDDINKNAAVLSPGEKARVALCKLLLQRANLLVLDEPTNHLDPETQAVIGGNFRQFEGTILVVSHNPSFVEQIGISRMLVLPSGEIRDYSRELLEYYYELNTADEE